MENQKEVKTSIPEGYEIDKEKSSFERIVFKKKVEKVKVWKDLIGKIKPPYSCRIEDTCIIEGSWSLHRLFDEDSISEFVDVKHAKSALAMSKISQLIPYYGGTITYEEWGNKYLRKYSIERSENKIDCGFHYMQYSFLSFHTKEQRDSFLENNEQLVKDYLMIE